MRAGFTWDVLLFLAVAATAFVWSILDASANRLPGKKFDLFEAADQATLLVASSLALGFALHEWTGWLTELLLATGFVVGIPLLVLAVGPVVEWLVDHRGFRG